MRTQSCNKMSLAARPYQSHKEVLERNATNIIVQLGLLTILFKQISICIPFSILPNHHVAFLSIVFDAFTFFHFTYVHINYLPLINNVPLGYACHKRDWNNMNGVLVIITHDWRRCSTAASHLPSKLHVLGHDGDALCVNCAQVGILK